MPCIISPHSSSLDRAPVKEAEVQISLWHGDQATVCQFVQWTRMQLVAKLHNTSLTLASSGAVALPAQSRLCHVPPSQEPGWGLHESS